MSKFILTATLYLAVLFIIFGLVPDDQDHIHEIALDQAEFNQSLPEIPNLQILESTFSPKK
jgi:hypothetical protein